MLRFIFTIFFKGPSGWHYSKNNSSHLLMCSESKRWSPQSVYFIEIYNEDVYGLLSAADDIIKLK